jgi:hypothetical protein
MNCSPTLTADEFKTIHNGLCALESGLRHLEGVLRQDLYVNMAHAASEIRRGLDNAYKQDQESFDRKYEHFQKVQEQLGLKSVWSVYEVEDMANRHSFTNVDRVVYKDHWGGKPVSCSINGLTWSALYVAADACIRDSGDNHHVFIEGFYPAEDDPRTLILTTGS